MKNKVFLITGGTTGIGLATARLLSAQGAKVIITGRNPETLAAARRELSAEVEILKSDAGSLSEAQAIGNEVKKYTAHLDGVFLNAGIGQFVPLEVATPQHFEEIFQVNVRGPYFQLQALLPLLKNPSSVVFNGSIAGSEALPNTSVYSATKAAIISLGKTLAVELAPRGLRVNTISPGPIDTPIMKKVGMPDDALKQMLSHFSEKSLLKRFGTADEVARLARFLLTDESSNITGTEIVIDGGVRLT